jgi:glycopeptide antibiotics resistance protein
MIIFEFWFYPIAIALYLLLRIGINKIYKFRIVAMEVFLLIYFLLIIDVTLFPIDYWMANMPQANEYGPNDNYIPFSQIIYLFLNSVHYSVAIKQIGGNILMMIPLGFLSPLVINRLNSFLYILFFGIGVSIFIELTQKTISLIINYNYRSFDVDDIILNCIGCISGYLLLIIFKSIINQYYNSVTINNNK